jgi:hypothetical protein
VEKHKSEEEDLLLMMRKFKHNSLLNLVREDINAIDSEGDDSESLMSEVIPHEPFLKKPHHPGHF